MDITALFEQMAILTHNAIPELLSSQLIVIQKAIIASDTEYFKKQMNGNSYLTDPCTVAEL